MYDWLINLVPHSRETLESKLFLIPLLPLIGFLLNGLFGTRYFSNKFAGFVGTLSAFLAFCWALLCVFNNTAGPGRQSLHETYGNWLVTPDFGCTFGLMIDKLSSVMILIVTGIGTLIHLYSIGYMSHDKGCPRFFAYLNLFLFAMILLVLGDNILILFVGWEGVGLCSYLLIGFWYEEGKNAAAGMKAFVVNRIGDLGFLIGIFLLICIFGTVNFVAPPQRGDGRNVTPGVEIAGETHAVTMPQQPGLLDYTEALRALYVKEPVAHGEGDAHGHKFTGAEVDLPVSVSQAKPELGLSSKLINSVAGLKDWSFAALITLTCLCLFVGATGKSAQIPLFVWLPDAMAGPTPVSALIHAATMVTAGIYMVCRLHPLFALSPTALGVVAFIGALTALFSALIGLTQLDIKRVLAYSTVSQLGYMFLGLGTGMFSLGIFHVLTHAFFKALLFLGSGSVIHAMSGEQDMRKMGGLRSKLPITFATMFVGGLALAGVPLFSGWYSKDEILGSTLALGQHNTLYLICYILGAAAAACTAFYTFRLIFLTFFGENRASDEVQHHIHESPWTMLFPLVVLAILSVFGGWMFSGLFVEHPDSALAINNIKAHSESAHTINLIVTGVVALAGIAFAAFRYGKGQNVPNPDASKNPLYKASLNKFYVDEIYDALIVFPFRVCSELAHWIIDVLFIDGLVTGSAYLVAAISNSLRKMQTGLLNQYAFAILSGALAMLVYLLMK